MVSASLAGRPKLFPSPKHVHHLIVFACLSPLSACQYQKTVTRGRFELSLMQGFRGPNFLFAPQSSLGRTLHRRCRQAFDRQAILTPAPSFLPSDGVLRETFMEIASRRRSAQDALQLSFPSTTPPTGDAARVRLSSFIPFFKTSTVGSIVYSLHRQLA